MMLVLCFLFQLGDRVMSTPVPQPWETDEELNLRKRIRDTVFDDIYLGKSAFLTTHLEIAKETLRLLPGIAFPDDVRLKFFADISAVDLTPLQEGHIPLIMLARIGTQRGAVV